MDPEWITVTLRAIGEMHGDQGAAAPNTTGSWINLSPWENNEFGVPRAYVRLVAESRDLQTWKAMDQAALDLAQALTPSPDKIQYLYDNGGPNRSRWTVPSRSGTEA